MQLAKLENSVDKKTQDVERTAAEAQRAADENKEAAAKPSDDSQDKKVTNRSKHPADDLADVNKDIESLKSKIADDKAKLAVNPVIISC